MKRGKDEEKMMGPMFPRLHVNDADKGGPRAPPRNKMALYEQLSIPSQRFNQTMLNGSSPANSGTPSNQNGGNEMHKFFSSYPPPRHRPDTRYSPYADLSTPLTRVENRARSDEDDFRVPIFVSSYPNQEYGKFTNDTEKLVPTNMPSDYMLRFPKTKDSDMFESSMRQGGNNQRHDNSKEMSAGLVKSASMSLAADSTASQMKRVDLSLCREQGNDPANRVNILNTDGNVRQTLCAESLSTSDRLTTISVKDIVASAERNSATSLRTTPSEDQNIVNDLSNVTESREDRSCGSMNARSLERGDSASETSILDSISGHDMITPDDVVGILGQKHFWRARRAISNQQRVFAVQVFELHRIIKVQKLIAASPNLLLEGAAFLHKPTKTAVPVKKLPLDYPAKAIANTPNQKYGDSVKQQSHRTECSAENTVEKTSSCQNTVRTPTPSCAPPFAGNSAAPSINSDQQAKPMYFNQQHQWLVPVMSPSEGLVYKPFPAPPGYMPPGPPNPGMGNFFPSPYGVPPQYHQFPGFPGPHGYFPPYGMPMMNLAALSGSSVEQTNPPQFFSPEANVSLPTKPTQKNGAFREPSNVHASEDVELQASTASSPSERGTEGRNVLSLFPTSPVTMNTPGAGPQQPFSVPQAPPEVVRPSRVIRVVPHNARTATESAARIFQSIQEERKQYDSV